MALSALVVAAALSAPLKEDGASRLKHEHASGAHVLVPGHDPAELPSTQQLMQATGCPEGCSVGATFGVHGDPMFKQPGSPGKHIWIQEGKLTRLLSWRSPEAPHDRFLLWGRTMGNEDEGHSWFDRFSITHDAKPILDVATTPNDAQMLVVLDGKPIPEAETKGHTSRHSSERAGGQLTVTRLPQRLSASHMGQHHLETLHIEVGGVRIELWSSLAEKYEDADEQHKYIHLNLNIHSDLSTIREAHGVFAELAGIQSMSSTTMAMTKPPPNAHPAHNDGRRSHMMTPAELAKAKARRQRLNFFSDSSHRFERSMECVCPPPPAPGLPPPSLPSPASPPPSSVVTVSLVGGGSVEDYSPDVIARIKKCFDEELTHGHIVTIEVHPGSIILNVVIHLIEENRTVAIEEENLMLKTWLADDAAATKKLGIDVLSMPCLCNGDDLDSLECMDSTERSCDAAAPPPMLPPLAPAVPGCPAGCSAGTTFGVHGDPMFRLPGSPGTHFWLKEGQLTPLFSWRSPDAPHDKFVLQGRTMGNQRDGHSWFDRFVITRDGEVGVQQQQQQTTTTTAALLDVETHWEGNERHQLSIMLAGEPVAFAQHNGYSSRHAVEWTGGQMTVALLNASHAGKRHDEKISIQVGGLQMELWTSLAAKYQSVTRQNKFMHLNLNVHSNLDTIRDAHGIFAELAGLQTMSQATVAMVRPSKAKPRIGGAVTLRQGYFSDSSHRFERSVECICPPPPPALQLAAVRQRAEAVVTPATALPPAPPVAYPGAPPGICFRNDGKDFQWDPPSQKCLERCFDTASTCGKETAHAEDGSCMYSGPVCRNPSCVSTGVRGTGRELFGAPLCTMPSPPPSPPSPPSTPSDLPCTRVPEAVCRLPKNAIEQCYYDESCSDPSSPTYYDGSGCNAGGVGQNCRFCGFVDPVDNTTYPDCLVPPPPPPQPSPPPIPREDWCPEGFAMLGSVADCEDDEHHEAGTKVCIAHGAVSFAEKHPDHPDHLHAGEDPNATAPSFSDQECHRCSSVTDLVIGPGAYIENMHWPFYPCFNLKTVVSHSSSPVPTHSFQYSELELASFKFASYIGFGAFDNSYHLRSVDASSATRIDNQAFQDCPALEAINASKATFIGDHAFVENVALTTVDVSSATYVGAHAFRGCLSLTSVDAGKAKFVGNHAFQDCTGLSSVNVSSARTLMGYSFASCSSLPSIAVPRVEYIETGAFKSATSLASVDLSHVLRIGEEAFYECEKLTTIDAASVTEVGPAAFKYATGLRSIDLGDVTDIHDGAFEGCSSLEEVIVSEGVSIGTDAFLGCGKLGSEEHPHLSEHLPDGGLGGFDTGGATMGALQEG